MKTITFVSVLLWALPSFAKADDFPYYRRLTCRFTLTDGKNTEKHRIVIFTQDSRGGRAMTGMGYAVYPSTLTYVQTMSRKLDMPIAFDLRITGTGDGSAQTEAYFELEPAKKVKKQRIRRGKVTLKTSDGDEFKANDVVCRHD